MPCYKYFILQEWHGSFSCDVKKDIKNVFAQNIAEWIICDSNTNNIQSILDRNYTLVAKIDEFRIYKLICDN